jgi:hypothetical protein
VRTEVIKGKRELQYVKVHKLFFTANIVAIELSSVTVQLTHVARMGIGARTKRFSRKDLEWENSIKIYLQAVWCEGVDSIQRVRFEVFTAVTTKIAFVCCVKLCKLVEVY